MIHAVERRHVVAVTKRKVARYWEPGGGDVGGLVRRGCHRKRGRHEVSACGLFAWCWYEVGGVWVLSEGGDGSLAIVESATALALFTLSRRHRTLCDLLLAKSGTLGGG
jgi:hypothetical protein